MDGRLNADRVRLVVEKVGEAKPRHFLNLLKDYQRLVRLETEKSSVLIESAAPLDDATAKELLNSLRAKYGQDLVAEFRVAPELIGGLRIKIGSDVYDSSVRERLNRLQSQFVSA